MPRSVLLAGSQSTTVGSDNVLNTWDAPAGGATYALVLDCDELAAGETLYVIVERETRSTDDRREIMRVPMAGNGAEGVVESPIFGAPAGVELRVSIRQEGGSSRAIPYSIERLDA
jgi:hypothetical protein